MKLQLMKKVCLIAAVFSVVFYGHSYGQAGTLDSTFGVNGKVVQSIDSASGMDRMALQQNGKIITGGTLSSNNQVVFGLLRYNTNGSLDSTFGTNGMSVLHVGTGLVQLMCLTIQPDDKILIGGYSYINSVSFWTVARFNADGGVDSTFADNGVKILDLNQALTIAVRPDGKIIISSETGTNSVLVITRLNADGSLDTNFGNQGNVVAPANGHFRLLNDMVLQPDNKILGLTVSSTQGFPLTVIRLKENGTPDSTFGTNGYVVTNLSGGESAIALQPDNKIIVVGGDQSESVVMRLDTLGSFDNNFGTGGSFSLPIGGNGNQSYYSKAVAIEGNGNIVVAGTVYSTPGTAPMKKMFRLTRVNFNGTLDNEFGNSGRVTTNFDSTDDDIPVALFIVDGGKILAGGISFSFSPYHFATVMSRYNSCGISITGQPANQTKGLGATASFTVSSTSPSAGYQWQTRNTSGWTDLSNGGQYSGSQSATLQVSNITVANDQQQFRAIALSGVCSDTSSAALLTVDTSLGIGRIALNAGFRLYPNPVNEHLTIATKALSDRIVEVTITDLAGKIILHRQLKGQSTVTLSTKTWAAGMYIAEVSLKGKAPEAVKLVKK